MRLKVNGGCQVIKICPGPSVVRRSVTASSSPAVYITDATCNNIIFIMCSCGIGNVKNFNWYNQSNVGIETCVI